MRTLHQLTATIDTTHPIPTEDGTLVTGTVEVVTECDPSGRATMRCRTVGDDTWHRVVGGDADLADPADLPFHHAAALSRLLTQQTANPLRAAVTPESVAFYFCDDLYSPPEHAA